MKKQLHKREGGLRKQVLTRDGHSCVGCGMTDEEHREKWSRSITVDHINGKGIRLPKKEKDNRLCNLQTLCLSCHGKKDIRRRKKVHRRLSKKQREEIVNKYVPRKYHMNMLAEEYGVTQPAIWLIINKARKSNRENWEKEFDEKFLIEEGTLEATDKGVAFSHDGKPETSVAITRGSYDGLKNHIYQLLEQAKIDQVDEAYEKANDAIEAFKKHTRKTQWFEDEIEKAKEEGRRKAVNEILKLVVKALKKIKAKDL